METKKLNIFTLIMVIVMCAFSIFISTNSSKGQNGKDGQDGQDMSILTIYQEYKNETGYEGTFSDFIDDYLGEKLTYNDEVSEAQIAAQLALCSTVDICYSYYMDSYYLIGSEGTATINGSRETIYFVSEASQPLLQRA